MRKLFGVLAILLGVSSTAPAQDAPGASSSTAPQAPTFRSGVELVTVDVGVIDQSGKPVDDLHAADFTVKIDGQVRRVESANLVRIDPEAAKKKLADKEETFFTTNLTPPEGRQIIFAIDQVNVRPGTLKVLMRTASQFVDKLSPLDQVAFRAYPEPGARVPFTADHIRVKLAMDTLIGHQDVKTMARMNIGVTEAIQIDEKRDEQTLLEVAHRECAGLTGEVLEQCRREIQSQASDIAYSARQTAEEGLRGLLDLLRELALVEGSKTMILLSEGVAISNPADLDLVSILAGRARVALNVLIVDEQRGDVSVARLAPTAEADRRRETSGLQNIAAASRGAVFHAVGTAEGVFERLLREMSAYYVLGVEQRPGDGEDKKHRIDVEVQRRGVTVRSPQAFALSAAARPKRSPEDNLQSALMSPFAVSEIPLRATTFVQQDPASPKVRVSVAADVGQPGTPPGEYSVAYVLVDSDNRIAANFARKVTLGSASHPATEPLPFVSTAALDPGVYSLRLAVVDRDGRRGSVIREVNAWKLRDEEFATSDLVVGNPPATPGDGLRIAVEPHLDADQIAAFVELYTNAPATLEKVAATFEIADDGDAPALTRLPGTIRTGAGGETRIAQAFIPTVALPPGRYVARVEITRDGKRLTVMSRPLVLERGLARVAGSAVVPPPLFVPSAIGTFDRAAVLRPELVSPMLDLVEKRSPALKDAMVEARAGRYGTAAIEALSAGDQEAAAFFRGFDLFTKGQLNEAAGQLQLSAGPRRQFFPAAFYLGAVFAAAGRDRDAAGTWQLALGSEPRPSVAYTLTADARIRDNLPDAAIDVLKPAYARAPTDDEIGRRLAMAYLMTSHYAEALPILDGYLSRHATDQNFLFAGVVAQYEVVRAGSILSNTDRDRVRRWANAYRGEQSALVDKYMQTMGAR